MALQGKNRTHPPFQCGERLLVEFDSIRIMLKFAGEIAQAFPDQFAIGQKMFRSVFVKSGQLFQIAVNRAQRIAQRVVPFAQCAARTLHQL